MDGRTIVALIQNDKTLGLIYKVVPFWQILLS